MRMESNQRSNEQEYMTVKEFAAAAGVTEQAVYKQLNNKLSTYSTELNGKKVLKIEALKEYRTKEVETELTQKLNETEAEVNRLKEQIQQQKVDELSKAVNDVNELKEQLRTKDQQIESLHDLLKESQEALNRQQQLTALQEKRITELTASDPEEAATVEHEGSEEAAEQTAAEQQRKGLFRRILEALTAD